MNSSQALAQSVLGNLAVHGHLDCLNDLQCDEGESFLGRAEVTSDNFAMEREVKHLGEPRPTSFDGYIDGDYRVGIECKFTESEVGTCSRPRLMPKASNFAKEHCDGNYSNKALGRERCPLTEIGVLYWRYIPSLFKWQNNIDMIPCPLKKNYQLARNILGVGVNAEGMVLPEDGHVVLIYDERNPAFQDGGDGFVAYWKTREALRVPGMLRRCSWQSIMQVMRRNEFLPWLMEQIDLKYRM